MTEAEKNLMLAHLDNAVKLLTEDKAKLEAENKELRAKVAERDLNIRHLCGWMRDRSFTRP